MKRRIEINLYLGFTIRAQASYSCLAWWWTVSHASSTGHIEWKRNDMNNDGQFTSGMRSLQPDHRLDPSRLWMLPDFELVTEHDQLPPEQNDALAQAIRDEFNRRGLGRSEA
ncbi:MULTISPECIES: hypothetical protein [unclassified Sphingomonas]|uniref:hypothetical protein n=1 Tax=unclassified Sphingomonas TaxID=196159 RepID=UPI002269A24A|nr:MULTISPECIES: hypothetical protein [unclassified Sphingomonas]